MKKIIFISIIVILVLFTGTWIFDRLAWLSDLFASMWRFLATIFNFFGWNKGIL